MKEITCGGFAWLGFWVFMAVLVYVDFRLYNEGHEAIFFEAKTPEEKRIREAKIKKLENQAAKGTPPS